MTKRLRKKIDQYCSLCGTQSCNPFDRQDRLNCPYFNSIVKKQQEEIENWLTKKLDVLKNF